MTSEDPVARMVEFNNKIIEEFRANGGKVTGPFSGAPLLLLTTTGAKSGATRTTPLAYSADGERLIIIASYAGNPKHPAWFLNLQANPQVTVELPNETFTTNVVITEGEERQRLFDQQAAQMPNFAEYQAKTTREIPVIVIPRP
jgi:deazaflavin-dependent oxidoreductase (nitroreductase family)